MNVDYSKSVTVPIRDMENNNGEADEESEE